MGKATAQPPKKKSATAKKKIVKTRTIAQISADPVDDRQAKMLAYFLDPASETFRNGRGSAIRAGFSEGYADQIIARMPSWLGEVRITEEDLVAKAEQNIREFLELPNQTQAMGAFGPVFAKTERKVKVKGKNGKFREKKIVEKTPVMTFNKGLLEIKQKTSHFVAETVGRDRYFKKTTKVGLNFNIHAKVAADKQAYA